LAGHKDSKPVRIGNGAADHKQLVRYSRLLFTSTDSQDIYGELLDCIYLAQKFSKPLVSTSTHSMMQVLIIVLGFMGPSQTGRGLCHDPSQREGSQYLGG
jgi:hypothetical protein